jgi:hypothetical protein
MLRAANPGAVGVTGRSCNPTSANGAQRNTTPERAFKAVKSLWLDKTRLAGPGYMLGLHVHGHVLAGMQPENCLGEFA